MPKKTAEERLHDWLFTTNACGDYDCRKCDACSKMWKKVYEYVVARFEPKKK